MAIKSQRTAALSLLVAIVFLQTILSVRAQSIVDNDKFCKRLSISCGEPDSPTSEKYCCQHSNGGYPVYSCCNPYIGLFIGLGVGVPAIIGIIVLIVLLYCWCVRYQNRKMRALIESYEQEESNSSRRTQDTSFVAPPPYTPLREEETDENPPESELPPYTESDPFTGEALPVFPSVEERVGSSSPSSETPHSSSGQNQPAEVIEVELEDVPLLSDDDEQNV